jgi:hypothetical protein
MQPIYTSSYRRREDQFCGENTVYNIAFVNSERWLAKSRVDITQCQHGNVGKFLSLYFFVLYYKKNIKHFFRIDIQLYQHSWKLGKLEIVWKHFGRRVSIQFLVFPISTRVDITVYQHGKCFIFVKYNFVWRVNWNNLQNRTLGSMSGALGWLLESLQL